LAIKQRKVEYLESIIERKNEYTEERDRLIIKQLEVKIINYFNMFRIPFVVGSFGVCLLAFFRSSKPLYLRLLPLIFLGTFSSMYNYHIGQYGVYRHLDDIYGFLTRLEGDTAVGREARDFLTQLEEEVEGELERRRELRRRREIEENGVDEKVTVMDAVRAAREEKKNEAEGKEEEESGRREESKR